MFGAEETKELYREHDRDQLNHVKLWSIIFKITLSMMMAFHNCQYFFFFPSGFYLSLEF